MIKLGNNIIDIKLGNIGITSLYQGANQIYTSGGLTGNMTFADPNVKQICVDYWGSDGEITYEQAAAVTTLGEVFNMFVATPPPEPLTSFNEFIYFTGLTEIESSAFGGNSAMTSILLPNTITIINEYAFSGSGLTSIVIPNGVTHIWDGAFDYCQSLTDIDIPTSVIYIGEDVFLDTPFYNNMADGDIYINSIYYKYKGTLLVNSTVSIAEGTIMITGGAFKEQSNLIGINIPNSVSIIGYGAFGDCTSLVSISVPNSITSIDGLCIGCTSLVSVTLPEGLEIIDRSFNGCSQLTSITLPDSLIRLGETAFNRCSLLEDIVLPEGLVYLGDWAFSECSSLNAISIPNSVTSIGEYTFQLCTNLTTVSLPVTLTRISTNMFYGCQLPSIIIPETIKTIETGAFNSCSSLVEITIPSAVAVIKDQVFRQCTSLTSFILLPTNPPILGSDTFTDILTNLVITVPLGSLSAYQTATGWSEYADKMVEAVA